MLSSYSLLLNKDHATVS